MANEGKKVHERQDKLVSLSGAPIRIYPEPEPGVHLPEREAVFLPEISDHIQRYLGPIAGVLHETVSEYVHIDVHWVPPNRKREFHTLVTSGMSDSTMVTPEGFDVPQRTELSVTLPPNWDFSPDALATSALYWPVRLLRSLARFPFVHQTWLGEGHTVPNGVPAEPYDATTQLCCALIVPSPTVPEEFQVLRTASGAEIFLYAVVPIHRDEMDYKLRYGTRALLERFDARRFSDLIGPLRPSVCGRRTGRRRR